MEKQLPQGENTNKTCDLKAYHCCTDCEHAQTCPYYGKAATYFSEDGISDR